MGVAPGPAQEAPTIPSPQPPYVNAPSDQCHWIVNFTYPAAEKAGAAGSPTPPASAPPAGQTTRIEVVKTGPYRHITVTMGDGST
jgi:hypothetical protein